MKDLSWYKQRVEIKYKLSIKETEKLTGIVS